MTPDQVQAWLNRTPAAAGSTDYQRAALALGQAFEGLHVRVAARPAPQPVMVVEPVTAEVSIDLDRPNRRGPYRTRAIHLASNHVDQTAGHHAPVRERAA
jgi:hypothetical protein